MNLFYDGTVDLVKPVWEDFDHRRYEFQNSIEQIALNLYKEDKQKMIDFGFPIQTALPLKHWKSVRIC